MDVLQVVLKCMNDRSYVENRKMRRVKLWPTVSNDDNVEYLIW